MDHQSYSIDDGPLKVERIKLINGANYFSSDPVVMIRLDLGEFDEVFTDQIPGFRQRLESLLPSLVEHRCSPGVRGGFFQRVTEGTLLGHVTEHVAIELENLAGMDAAYGKTRSTKTPRVYHVVFGLIDHEVGILTAKGAVNAVNALLMGRDFDVDGFVRALIDLREKRLLGPSTQAIVDAAERRLIPWLRLDRYNLVQLGIGKVQKHIRATITSQTRLIAVETADDKFLTFLRLHEAGIPVPKTIGTEDMQEALEFLSQSQRPIVVKPAVGHSGVGITLRIGDSETLAQSMEWAQEMDPRVVVQEQIPGHMFRLLVIDGTLVAAVRRTPPIITGDGRHTVAELIDILNQDPQRGVGDKTPLTKIALDPVAHRVLANRGLTEDSVLPLGKPVLLHVSPAAKFGGSATDVTDTVHPVNRFLAERAARTVGLDVAGVDILAPDISHSILNGSGAVLGVSAAPDFRPHLSPSSGKRRDVATPVVNMLFPEGCKTRVPIFSITGSFGKTSTAYLLSHALAKRGYRIGMVTSHGLFLEGRLLSPADATNQQSVNLVLRDPDLDLIILETPLEQILSDGLGYSLADYGIVLNVCDNNPDTDELDDAQDIAYAKSVVAEQIYDDGYAILNADDPLVLEMKRHTRGKKVLFSQSYDHEAVRDHVDQGGLAAVLDRGTPFILDSRRKIELSRVEDIPLTQYGQTSLNHETLLATIAALYAFGFPVDIIDDTLRNFVPTAQNLLGNLNLWKTQNGIILLDGAQHLKSIQAIQDFLRTFSETKTFVMGLGMQISDEDADPLANLLADVNHRIILVNERPDATADTGSLHPVNQALIDLNIPVDQMGREVTCEQAWVLALKEMTRENMVVILTSQVMSARAVIESHVRKLEAQSSDPKI